MTETHKTKILIVEFYNWHDECLYTTCKLLKNSNINIALALNEDIRSRTPIFFSDVANEIIYLPFRKGFKGLTAIWKLYRYLIKNGFTHICFNTASGSEALKFFMLPMPKHIKFIGTLHNVAKLSTSSGQRFITKHMDGYILLNDILRERYGQLCKLPATTLYPIIYPESPAGNIQKPKDEIWIAIPGSLALSRRDYLFLVPKTTNGLKYRKEVKFIILGNRLKADGDKVYSEVCKAGVQDNFVFFDGFVPNNIFLSYMQQCDYLMPLVHPKKEEYRKYMTEKISGTYNLAFAYKKPMLCPEEMAVYEDFRDTSIFYTYDNFECFINGLSNNGTFSLYRLEKWKEEVQQNRLIEFINNL